MLLMQKLTVSEAGHRLGRSPELVRRWLREGRLTGENFGGVWIVDEHAVVEFARNQPQRRYYKISWVRWRVRNGRWTAWHFQPRIPYQSLACDEEGPAAGVEFQAEYARGVTRDAKVPDGPRCQTCDRVARRMVAGLA